MMHDRTARTLEQLIDEAAQLGQIRLSRQDSGRWHAGLKFPAPEGVTAEVSSGFNAISHRAAMLEMFERFDGLRAAVNAGSSQSRSQVWHESRPR